MTSRSAGSTSRPEKPREVGPGRLGDAGSWRDAHHDGFEQEPPPCGPGPRYEVESARPGEAGPACATDGTAWDAVGPEDPKSCSSAGHAEVRMAGQGVAR